MRRRWTLSLLSLLLLLAACGGDGGDGDGDGRNTGPVGAIEPARCVAAESETSTFIRGHPGGLVSLTPEERDTFQRLSARVEGDCSLEEATRFGRDVLEPWAAINSDPRCTGASGSTGRACDPP